MSVLLNRARTVSVIWYQTAKVTYTELVSWMWHRIKLHTWDEWNNNTWDNME